MYRKLLWLLLAVAGALYIVNSDFLRSDSISRVKWLLHAMPSTTTSINVVTAKNFVFDQPNFQLPDEEEYLQLSACSVFWDIKNLVKSKDVELCAWFTAKSPSVRVAKQEAAAANFIFLKKDDNRDREIRSRLREVDLYDFTDGGCPVYFVKERGYLSIPKPGLLVFASNDDLMHKILSRLDAWWLPRVAMATNKIDWENRALKASYWAIGPLPPMEAPEKYSHYLWPETSYLSDKSWIYEFSNYLPRGRH